MLLLLLLLLLLRLVFTTDSMLHYAVVSGSLLESILFCNRLYKQTGRRARIIAKQVSKKTSLESAPF